MVCGWRLPRPIINSHAQEKVGVSWARGLPKILGFPFNISIMTEASDFKIDMQPRFAKTHNKIPPGKKVGVALG